MPIVAIELTEDEAARLDEVARLEKRARKYQAAHSLMERVDEVLTSVICEASKSKEADI